MFVICVTIWVKQGTRESFITASKENAKNTRQREPGNLRFDVLECADDKNQFFLYEVYKEEKDLTVHKETPHYKKWKETVEPLMAKPRERTIYTTLFPEKAELFRCGCA